MDILQELAIAAEKYPDNTALVDSFGRLSFARVGKVLDEMVDWLRGHGCGRGDRVATLTLVLHVWALQWVRPGLELGQAVGAVTFEKATDIGDGLLREPPQRLPGFKPDMGCQHHAIYL